MAISRKLQKTLDKVSKVSTQRMTHKGFKASLMRAKRLEDRDKPHGLPPGTPITTVEVDALPGCPEEWVRGPGSYVCPVDTSWGLWFQWTENDSLNTSVLTSVKGMNPITGKKIDSLKLESYKEKCPIHDEAFKGNERFCEKCNYKWPPQNYVSSPNTLWWDGFRQADGTVRQFFFSEDEKRDIASLVIGKQNTVPAFGFVFYEPKKRRELPRRCITRGFNGTILPQGAFGASAAKTQWYNSGVIEPRWVVSSSQTIGDHLSEVKTGATFNCCAPVDQVSAHESPKMKMASPPMEQEDAATDSIYFVRDVSVGAGAEIRQDLAADTLSIDEWKEEPAGMIRLYFVFAEQFAQIVQKGVKDLSGDKEGYLKGLPIG